MKTLKVLTIVAITGLAGSVALNASPSNGQNNQQCQANKCDKCQIKKHARNKNKMKKIFQQLDLTPEQKTAMKSLRKGMREEMKAKRAEMRAKRGMSGMGAFVSANGFDKQGFLELAAHRSQKRAEMRANMFEQKMNILTPEQRVKLATLLQEK